MLGSVGIYYFSILKALEMVIKSLESLHANFFWGSHESSKKLSWVKWSNTLASFDKGGLGVGSLSDFNKALLLKWRWRLFNFSNSLWVQLEMVLLSTFGRILGLEMILFISDIIDYSTLKTIKIASLVNVFLMVHGNGIDRLPNRLNLSSRGLDIDSISCIVCNGHVESNDHIFFTCDTAVAIWNLDHGLIFFQAFSRVKIRPTGLIHVMFLRTKEQYVFHLCGYLLDSLAF
uniref:RNA-directed DNA polymerase, eukaryota, reverse transcriptase zinc-binding domain protein n=1 Tax=Tanacetum cinerariifolium TaxID=118510 RepID=A0A699KV42_TANCI|nr:RNA-directed DNA polymerase, eukaryota, reverse transcriptase zinc-binding domain protein [Tanacetum cinerariifolium]GFB07369.1 RNA-directed DNA polymerase, eukaryota, reverse transcriptase zinc-binding domain protein [Tanacetum cinerariifolium]